MLREVEADLVVLAGYLCLLRVPPDFENRVMNIHPALIPSFCGKGLYGMKVHEAVLARGSKLSGCTVHFADNLYDHGPIIVQKTVPVLEDDTPQTLAARVYQAECQAFPEADPPVCRGPTGRQREPLSRRRRQWVRPLGGRPPSRATLFRSQPFVAARRPLNPPAIRHAQ